MNKWLKYVLEGVFDKLGYFIIPKNYLPGDFTPDEQALVRSVQPYTMTSPERIYALVQAVEYITQREIPGDIVECGVWKGGSMMAVAQTLLALNQPTRHLYLFDTFAGMTKPSDLDGSVAVDKFEDRKIDDSSSNWAYAALDEVKQVVYRTGYDPAKIHFVKGKVEDTLPEKTPEKIALLRLDTDWYESTKHELIHLFPRLSPGGVLILDDYNRWPGARKATDEFFAENNISMLLNRIDGAGRIGLKV